MLLEDFGPGHISSLVECWNEWTEPAYAIDERLLQQLTFGHESWQNSRSALALDRGLLVGFVLARFQGQQLVVDALAVAPQHRRKGLASSLLERVKTPMTRFGGGPAHFLPGLPEDWLGAKCFFAKHGFQPDWLAEDLHMTMGPRELVFGCATAADKSEVLKMVEREFSRRWTRDTRARFEIGDTQDVILLKRDGNPIAFCHTWHYRSQLLGPSVFWLRNTVPKFGGIGPVGVVKSERGKGLGRRVVLEALNYLCFKEVKQVVVDWTSIGPFYEKCGFQSWRRYRGYSTQKNGESS